MRTEKLVQRCPLCKEILVWPMSFEQYALTRHLNRELGGTEYYKPMTAVCNCK